MRGAPRAGERIVRLWCAAGAMAVRPGIGGGARRAAIAWEGCRRTLSGRVARNRSGAVAARARARPVGRRALACVRLRVRVRRILRLDLERPVFLLLEIVGVVGIACIEEIGREVRERFARRVAAGHGSCLTLIRCHDGDRVVRARKTDEIFFTLAPDDQRLDWRASPEDSVPIRYSRSREIARSRSRLARRILTSKPRLP